MLLQFQRMQCPLLASPGTAHTWCTYVHSCKTTTNIKFKIGFSFFCILPLFLPPISFGFSLLALFGKNGLLYTVFGFRIPLLGEAGVIFGLILYTFPIAFLMFRNAMLEIDGTVYESAFILGIPIIKTFFNITIPQIRKTIISVVLLVSSMSLTEYGVCLVVGGKIKTISLLIYRQVVGALDFSSGIILCFMLIVPILFMLIFEIVIPQVKRKIIYKKFVAVEDQRRDFFAYIILSCVSIFFCVIIFSFVIIVVFQLSIRCRLYLHIHRVFPIKLFCIFLCHFKIFLQFNYTVFFWNIFFQIIHDKRTYTLFPAFFSTFLPAFFQNTLSQSSHPHYLFLSISYIPVFSYCSSTAVHFIRYIIIYRVHYILYNYYFRMQTAAAYLS